MPDTMEYIATQMILTTAVSEAPESDIAFAQLDSEKKDKREPSLSSQDSKHSQPGDAEDNDTLTPAQISKVPYISAFSFSRTQSKFSKEKRRAQIDLLLEEIFGEVPDLNVKVGAEVKKFFGGLSFYKIFAVDCCFSSYS